MTWKFAVSTVGIVAIVFVSILVHALESNSVAFHCSVREETFGADFKFSSVGEATLDIKDEHGEILHSCELATENFGDFRKALSPEIRIDTRRQKACRPRLGEPWLSQLEHDIGVRISYIDMQKLGAKISLLRNKDDLDCKIEKIRVVDLESYGRRRKANPPKTFDASPPAEPMPAQSAKPRL